MTPALAWFAAGAASIIAFEAVFALTMACWAMSKQPSAVQRAHADMRKAADALKRAQ